MQCITVLVAVIATSSLTIEGVSGQPSVDVKAVDVKSLLQSLKALQQGRGLQHDRYGSLNSNVQPSSYKKQSVGSRQQYYEKYAKQRKQRYNDRPPLFEDLVDLRDDNDGDDLVRVFEGKPQGENKDRKQNIFNQNALDDLFSSNTRLRHQKPSSLLSNGNEDALDLDKYSRIYVVLNPQALKQDKDVADLVSQVAREGVDNDVQLYNGFAVDGNLLRRASDMIDEPVSKRPRYRGLAEGGREGYGGGGGAGGRTAIPYLKHRGDIYERDE